MQHISKNQLKELSKKGKLNLARLWKYLPTDRKGVKITEIESHTLPLLTTDNLIEIIDILNIPWSIYRTKNGGYGWMISISEEVKPKPNIKVEWCDSEEMTFRDSVWKTAKQVIEKFEETDFNRYIDQYSMKPKI